MRNEEDLITGQVSLFDLPGLTEIPLLWDCMETCVHAGGPWDDHFPGRPDKPRCNYPSCGAGITNGKWIRERKENNLVRHYCICYEKRETAYRLP